MLLFYETWFIILMLIICPPFGIMLMVKNSYWEKRTQIIAGIISVILFIGIILGTISLVSLFSDKSSMWSNDDTISETQEPTITPDKTDQTTAPESSDDNRAPNGSDKEQADTNKNTTAPTETPAVTLEPTPTEDPDKNDPDSENLLDNEKYLYLLSEELNSNESYSYNFLITPVTQVKYDLAVEIITEADINLTQELKRICEAIFRIGYKSKTMQIVLKVGNEIGTIKDYSSEILPNINCSLFEDNNVVKKTIIISTEQIGG